MIGRTILYSLSLSIKILSQITLIAFFRTDKQQKVLSKKCYTRKKVCGTHTQITVYKKNVFLYLQFSKINKKKKIELNLNFFFFF